MQYIKPDVTTVCIGQAASMGALLLAAGADKKRYALPHARIMIHQPMGGFQGQASDIAIQAKEILRMKDALNEHPGASYRQRAWMMSRRIRTGTISCPGMEAKEYGIVDHVITNRDDLDHLTDTEA
jgi:ATP-dependent Clp protease protease subunit